MEEVGGFVEPKAMACVLKTPEYSFNFRFDASDFAPREKKSPTLSPFSVSISSYSLEDENGDGGNGEVDDQAEDFIRRVNERLRMQSRMQPLQYQEMLD